MTRRRFSERAYLARLLEYGGRCAECGCKTGGANGLEWDHVIPLELGGDDEIDNLQPLCRACHRSKSKGDVKSIAKAKRNQKRTMGIRKQSSRPLPGGKDDEWKHTINRGWVRRDGG